MIFVVVSTANRCVYCQAHHGAALNNYWKDEQRVEQLKKGIKKHRLMKLILSCVNTLLSLH